MLIKIRLRQLLSIEISVRSENKNTQHCFISDDSKNVARLKFIPSLAALFSFEDNKVSRST